MAKDKKGMSAKTGGKAKLLAELSKLARDINEEGLLFLIEQANVLKYNMQVDMINREKQKISSGAKSGSKGNAAQNAGVEIFPGEENKNFIIQLGSMRKFMSRQDFRSIVLIAQSPDSVKEVSARLYHWLEKERQDFLIDCNIRSASNSLLPELIKLIKGRYKVK